MLHRFYGVLLGSAIIGWIVLSVVGERGVTDVVFRLGLLESGRGVPVLLRTTRLFAAGSALGLIGYFCSMRAKRVRSIALFITIVAPALSVGYGWGWYERPLELDVVLSPPPEIQFLRERIPNHAYRVGVILSSEMQLAGGDWIGFRTKSIERNNGVLACIRVDGLQLRQGLDFVLPWLHFYAPVHSGLRSEGNPFLQRPGSREAQFLNRRNVIVRPEAECFEEYGVRYWLSNFDLQRFYPRKFVRVFEGEIASVYENPSAKPVAYFLGESGAPLSLEHVPYGVAIALPGRRGGKLSVHLDLRRMDARAVDLDGRTSPLVLEPSGLRWMVNVPPGKSSVVFTAKESFFLRILAMGSVAAFLFLLVLVFVRTPEPMMAILQRGVAWRRR